MRYSDEAGLPDEDATSVEMGPDECRLQEVLGLDETPVGDGDGGLKWTDYCAGLRAL